MSRRFARIQSARRQIAKAAMESLESRIHLSAERLGVTEGAPTLAAFPNDNTGTLNIQVTKDGSGNDISFTTTQIYKFVLSSPRAVAMTLSASNALAAATGFQFSIYQDDGPLSAGIFDFDDDTRKLAPLQVGIGATITPAPLNLSTGTYYARILGTGDVGQIVDFQAIDSSVDFRVQMGEVPILVPPAFATLASNGTLTINGTASNDVINIIVGKKIQATLGNTSLAFNKASVTKIIVNALGGNDSVNLNTVNVPASLIGGEGNDTLIGGLANDTLSGGNGNDSLTGADGDDSLDGGAGADFMDGGLGLNDHAYYFSRSEALLLSADNIANDGSATDNQSDNIQSNIEVLSGGNGNDRISGSAVDNALAGNNGNDTLIGGKGHDILLGGPGDDLLDGGTGADVFDGDTGNDTATYAARTDGLIVTLNTAGNSSARTGDDGGGFDGPKGQRDNVRDDIETIIGGSGSDLIAGSVFSNRLIGAKGNDLLNGGNGNDTLDGGKGHDQLHGDNGNDSLIGGTGNDSLFGDADNDTLLSIDAATDALFGGNGTDTATRDALLDTTTNNDIETLLS